MIESFTAFTNEIDDIKQAISEISSQLDLNGTHKLRKNTIGIVSCYTEYLDTGVVKALRESLPFDIIGTTTIACGSAGELGETLLVLQVLTSDDISFAISLSDPVSDEDEAPIRLAYESAAVKIPGKPSLILSFAPLLTNVGCDFYIDCMDKISGNVPNFGGLAVDHNSDYMDSRVIFNGEGYRDRFAIVLVYGDLNPKFYIGSISDEKIFQEKGVVTASKGNQLQTIDGISAGDYLQSLGLKKNDDGNITGINSFPIIVDYNDGTMPVARAMFALTPEGYAVCGGNIPVGATLSIGSFNPDEIVETTRRTLVNALSDLDDSCNALIMYSCIGRYFAQGYDQMIELESTKKLLEDKSIPYFFAYSGGELCPTTLPDGSFVNRNHNNTFIICAF